MGSWRDFWESLKDAMTPPSVKLQRMEGTLEEALLDNERLRQENGRLRKAVKRLEGQVETAQGKEEAERQKAGLLRAQAKRCKCRS